MIPDLSRRLIPLPKKCRVDGWLSCLDERISVQASAVSDSVMATALQELRDMVATLPEVATLAEAMAVPDFTIRLQLEPHIVAQIPTGYQRYSIRSDRSELTVVGESSVACLYGVKTLKQALFRNGERLLIPLLQVLDSADMAERGFWDYFYPAPIRETSEMYSLQTPEAWHAFIDDLTDYKINLQELLLVGNGVDYESQLFPELVSPGLPVGKNALVQNVMAYAAARGMLIFPSICHPEQFETLLQLVPEGRAQNVQNVQSYLHEKLLCFSHTKIRAVYIGLIEELAVQFEPHGISVWMPENRGCCTCSKCHETGYLQAFFSMIDEGFEKARLQSPGLRKRILASFMHYSADTLALLPTDAELVYYECDRHGMYCYDREKTLSPFVCADIRASRRRVLGCASFRGCGQAYVPLPTLDTVSDWIQLMVRDGYYGVNGSLYSNPGVNRMNLLRMAAESWHSGGHDTEAFLYAYAQLEYREKPAVRAAILAGLNQGWETYHRISQGYMEFHLLKWMRPRGDANAVDGVYVTDGLEFRDLPEIQEALQTLQQAVALAEENAEDLMAQIKFCQDRLRVLYHIWYAARIFGRQQWPDPEKGPWDDWLKTMREHLLQAHELLEQLPLKSRLILSRYPAVPLPTGINVDNCLTQIERLLSADTQKQFADHAWPDINAFA